MTLSLIVLALAACGGGQTEPTATPEATATEGPSPLPPPTPTAEGTEDPDEGLIFNELTLVRSGGLTGQTLTVTVLGNGALLRDGELLGGVDESAVADLDAQLDRMGFFRLEAQYGPGEARPDTFQYEVFASRGGGETSVRTADGFVPDALQQLINDLLALQPTGPAPAPTVDPNQPAAEEGAS